MMISSIHSTFISKEIPEERVRKFCGKLGLNYDTDKECEQVVGTPRH